MAKRKHRSTEAPSPSPVSEPSQSAALKKQDRYGSEPWQPGEIPTRTGSLRPITGPLDAKRAPYGEFLGVEKPTNRGHGKPREGQP